MTCKKLVSKVAMGMAESRVASEQGGQLRSKDAGFVVAFWVLVCIFH